MRKTYPATKIRQLTIKLKKIDNIGPSPKYGKV